MLLYRALGKDIYRVQLEHGQSANEYYRSEYVEGVKHV